MPNMRHDTSLLQIDLNADLGEGGQFDADILKIVSSANIACGGHIGDTNSMRQAICLAQENQVAIGAHPSFVDKENFGRKIQHPAPPVLFDQLCRQVDHLFEVAEKENATVHHLKPHGALYNQAANDTELGEVLIRVIQRSARPLSLVALAGSKLVTQAQAAGISVIQEAFADRRYNSDGSLRARTYADACITDDVEAIQQTLQLVQHQQLTCIDGTLIPVYAQTLCVHGDGTHALQLLTSIRSTLKTFGVVVAPATTLTAPPHLAS